MNLNRDIPARIAGILMIGVFLINVYIGLYDKNLSSLNMTHYYLNWVIAVVSIIAAIVLITTPRSMTFVALAGIVWPIVYFISLGVDVETKLCLGAPSSSCWPSHTAALDYLIFNYGTIPNAAGFGWKLFPVIPIALVLLVVALILSIIAIYFLRRPRIVKATGPPVVPPKTYTPEPKPVSPPPSENPPTSPPSS